MMITLRRYIQAKTHLDISPGKLEFITQNYGGIENGYKKDDLFAATYFAGLCSHFLQSLICP